MSVESNRVEETFDGEVAAFLPLALLESVRTHDHPGEVLEDEDLTVSLPRRLGMSLIIGTQIQRYETAHRAGRAVRLDEVVSLIRLVLRRPDAELILRETGRRIARWRYDRISRAAARLYRTLPLRAAVFPAARAARRLFRFFRAGPTVRVQRQPFAVRVAGCNTARIDASEVACVLFTAALEEHLQLYTGKPWQVTHARCEAKGDEQGEWSAIPG